VAHGAECCPHCGYSLAVTDDVFGADPVLLDRVTDAAGVMSDEDRDKVEAALLQFEQRLPQLFAVVYCGALPPQTSLRQFGFWLLNRAAVCELDVTRPNEHGVLFIIDTHGRSAALILGYFLECYLDEPDTRLVLEAARHDFHRGLWAAGIVAALRELTVRLRRRAAEAAKAPSRFAPVKPPAPPAAPQFVRLRKGGRRALTTPKNPQNRP
jgi:uncharacterized membrane protein YgcG